MPTDSAVTDTDDRPAPFDDHLIAAAAPIADALAAGTTPSDLAVVRLQRMLSRATHRDLWAAARGANGHDRHHPRTVLAVAAFAELTRQMAATNITAAVAFGLPRPC